MEIDLLQWSIILVLSISLWLPQLLITDALQVENNSTAFSCEENGTFTDIYSARQTPWPKPFEPFDTTSQAEFTPLVTASHSLSGVTPNSTKTPDKSTTTTQINPTPSIIRYLISPSPSLPSSPMQSNLQSSQLLLFSSSSTMAPTPSLNSMTSSTLKPVTTLELISNKQNAASTMSIFQLSSSPVQAPSVNTDTVIMPPSSLSPNVNDNVTFHLNYSHTVSSDKPTHHGHQPSGSQQINHVITTAITPTLTDNLPDELSINPNNGAFDNIKSSPTLTTIEVSSSPSLTNQPNTSDTNETSKSHMDISPSPSSSSYFPALSGTISIIPSDSSLDSSTTDFPVTSNPVDNSEIDNSLNNETNNHGEDSLNHHGIPQAATSNSTKCDPSDTRFSQPATSGFLVRSVLKRDEDLPLNADNLTIFFETRLAEVFTKAYHKQFNKLNGGSDVIKKDVHVKLWNLFWNNSTNDIHIIYQIEQDKEKILPRDLITVLSHVTPQEMSNILGYNVTIKAEPYVNTLETKNNLAATLQDLDWLPLVMIILSLMVFIFCSLLTLIVWRKNRRLLSSSSSSNQLSSGEQARSGNIRSKASHMVKPLKASTKENLVNWRKVSAPGSKRSFLGSHGSNVGLNISGGCSATSGTIDSNHEFEYLSFDSPESSLKLRTAEYRSRRPFTAFPNGLGSQSRLELTKEKVIPIGELDEIAELSSNDSSHDHHHHPSHQVPGSRVTYVTTKEEMIGDYENPLMRSGIDEVDCTVPQLIQVHISEQTQNIIQAIRSELKKFNPITGNVQSQSQSSTAHFKEPSTTSDA